MIRPICFVVMPFGEKPTGTTAPGAPAVVDFDALWRNAFEPALRQLGYDPVRADQDTSALIIQEMLERLAASDLIVADLSIPNANVYYEVGFRHGVKETGCVLIAADWSKPLFDMAQMRRLSYPLRSPTVSGEDAQKIADILFDQLPPLAHAQSPAYQSIAGFPVVDPKRLGAFRESVRQLSDFQARVNAVRRAPAAQRSADAKAVVDDYGKSGSPAVALELLFLVRDAIGFAAVAPFIDGLPPTVQNSPIVREQRYLATAKTGDVAAAIGALEALIETSGSTPEREGLLGGRYKQRFGKDSDPADLDRAIEHYERGMKLDLNAFYCSSNLPRLLRRRNEPGDQDRARLIAHAVTLACERTKELGLGDKWLNPTLLASAFDAGDLSFIETLTRKVRAEGHAAWMLETTLNDIDRAIALHTDDPVKTALGNAAAQLRKLVPNA